VTFRHILATDSIKNHVSDKLEKFKKYLIRPIEAHVILSVEKKIRQQCEITLSARDFHATAVETSDDLYTSIDKAIHKIERQVKKHKEIVKEHKNHLPIHSVTALAEEEFQNNREV
jgi:putative sigma-54 modulation protein